MAKLQRRSFTSLPGYLQTNRNNLELAVSDDLLFEPEQAAFVSGYIGDTSRLSAEDLARTPLLVENSAIRQKYQFSVAVAQFDPATQTFVSGAFYDDLLNHLALNGALIDDPNRLFSSSYYAWSPPIDYDKIVNPARYFWTGGGTAANNGEYITKEAAGSQTVLHQYDGTALIAKTVTLTDGLPIPTAVGELVEDISTTDRFLYRWTGFAWARLSFLVSDTTDVKPNYFVGDYVYVCRTGLGFNRPLIWVYRPGIGRWLSVPVVINIMTPDAPVVGMIWEDISLSPTRVLRVYDGSQWQILQTGMVDVFDGTTVTYDSGAGPSGIPVSVTYRYDIRAISTVDSWSAQNWWRELSDLSAVDRAVVDRQATRPILEFWGNIETAVGDTRTQRNQFPLFNLYGVSYSSFAIVSLTPTNFPGLDTAPLTTSGNYVGGEVVSHIFDYVKINGVNDPVLGFAFQYASDGTPQFNLEMELLPITISGSALRGYRFYRDTATGFVHSIWEKATTNLVQVADDNGLYDIPPALKMNSEHTLTTTVARSQFAVHFTSVMQAQDRFSGTPYGTNNYRYTPKNLTFGATMIDPQEGLFRILAVLQTNRLDIPDAIRTMARQYNKVMSQFLNQLNILWEQGSLAGPDDVLKVTVSQAVDIILTIIFAGRNEEFPFYNSRMGTFQDTRIDPQGNVYVFDPNPQPIYIPDSAPQIGAAPAYLPQKFQDHDNVVKLRGHDGSLIPAYGDARDDIVLALENRFYAVVPGYLKDQTSTFDERFNNARFHIEDYYGNYTPNLTAGLVSEVVANYTAIVSPTQNQRVYSTNTNVYAVWDGVRWLVADAVSGDVFQETSSGQFWIFNGFFADVIKTYNNTQVVFDYSITEYRQVIQREFERWIIQHKLDFITNNSFDDNDLFTWNYSSAGVEGNYRGIYRRLYHTIRPHSHPWEVIGYSVRPDWWLAYYVPSSVALDGTPRYFSSHQMWVDFQNGIINPISHTINLSQRLIAPIPVDLNGELVDPITSGLVDEQALTPASLNDDWQYGDGSPIEDSFYASYYYQFAVALAGYLMKPVLFVPRTWSEFYRTIGDIGSNLLWNFPHNVYNTTLTRPKASLIPLQLSLDSNGNAVANPGLNAWIAEYANLIGVSANIDFSNAINNCQVVVGWKTSGFINQSRTKIEILAGDEIPFEDLSVVLHQGPSINEYFQTGIQIVRDTNGFRVFGTDLLNPYFRVEIGAKPVIGGQIELSEAFFYGYFLTSVSIAANGIGYQVNDVLTLVGGKFNQVATVKIIAVDGEGRVTNVAIDQIGSYIATVDNPVGTTGGSGSGFKILAFWILTSRNFTTTTLTVPPVSNDTATFAIIINGYRIQDKFVQRINATSFTIDPMLQLNLGDKITANVVTTTSNPGTQLGSFTINHVVVPYFQTGTGVYVDYPYGTLFETLSDVVNMMVGYGRWLSSQGWIFERLTNGVLRDWLGAGKTFVQWATDLSLQTRGNPSLMHGAIFEYSVMGRNAQFDAPSGMVLGVEDIRNGSYGVVDVQGQPIRGDNLDVISSGGSLTVTSNDTDIFGLRIYVSEIQHVVFFPNTTTFGDVIYEPALGLAQDAVFVDTYRTTNWAGRMEAPGFLIFGGQLLPNWEKETNDITRLYDRFDPPDDPILLAMSRNLFGYVPKSYMDELNADDRTQFNFFRGTRKVSGTFQPYRAFVRGTTLGSDKVTISEDWAWKFARYGDRRIVTVLFAVDEVDFVDVFQAIHFQSATFLYTFTGDEHTRCFVVIQQFISEQLVVLLDDVLQIMGLDYTVAPHATGGNEICFVVPPDRNSVVSISLNETYAQATQNVFFAANSTSIDTGLPVVAAGVLLFLNGLLQGNIAYSTDNTIINYPVPPNTPAYAFVVENTGDSVFIQTLLRGDGFTTAFSPVLPNQSLNSLIVAIDGVWQTPGIDYTVIMGVVNLAVVPGLSSQVLLIEAANPNHMRSFVYGVLGDGVTQQFNVPGTSIITYRQVIVAIDGLVQVGPVPSQTAPTTYAIAGGGVHFNTPPALNAKISFFVLLGTVGKVLPTLTDDRILQIPMFSPPNADSRWIVPPPQDVYQGKSFSFPVTHDGSLDLGRYIFTAVLVDQSGQSSATNFFHWDPARDIHEPLALSLVDYKSPYDPARYNQGPLAETANGLVWDDVNIGQVWWNTATAIYEDYVSFLPDHMRVTREWGRLKYFPVTVTRVDEVVTVTTLDLLTNVPVAHGLINGQVVAISGADQPPYNGIVVVMVASPSTFTFTVNVAADTPATGDIIVQIGFINCYEWVASPVPPSGWDNYVHSQEQLFNAYSGTVLNLPTPSYVTREVWDVNGNPATTYYFWVENNTRVVPGKEIAVRDIAGRLRSPAQYEAPFFAIIDPVTMFVFIGADVVLDGDAIEISYQWYETPRHIEWLLIGENDDFAKIPSLVTDKLLDSLLGQDTHGNLVPNPTLAPDERYGTSFFPAQIVFQSQSDALNIFVDTVNRLLLNTDLVTVSPFLNFLVESNGELSNGNPSGFWSKTTFWVSGIDNTIIYDTVETLDELGLRTNIGLYAINDIVKVIQSDQTDIWNTTTYSLGDGGSIVNPGSGYIIGDVIELVGGKHTIIAELLINSITGMGRVVTYSVTNAGLYTILPLNPIETIFGSGSGLTFNAVWGHSPILSAYYQYDGTVWNLVGIENHTIEINTNITLNATQMRQFFDQLTANFDTSSLNHIIFNMLFEMMRQNPLCDWFFKTSYIDIHVTEQLPMTQFVRPDEAQIVFDAILDLKPFRTKIRDRIVSYDVLEPVNVALTEDVIEHTTLIFDRLACDLNDENAWDTTPWDATATYPENDTVIDLFFIGNGVQSCFKLPEAAPAGNLFVFVDGFLASSLDYVFDPVGFELCFIITPPPSTQIEVVINGPYQHFGAFSYEFRGDGIKNTVTIPNSIAETTVASVFSTWNGTHQEPVTDFTLQITSDTEVLYSITPSSEIVVDGLVFGGVVNDVFTTFLFISDGVTTQYSTNIGGLSTDVVIVSIDGVWQSAINAFSLDFTNPDDNQVVLLVPPAAGARILMYVPTNPRFMAMKLHQFVGDGAKTLYLVPNLLGTTSPKILVDLDGIQQLIGVDYALTSTGILFTTAPGLKVQVDIMVIGVGIGFRPIQPVAYPLTIQWDWAYWDYADLGRQEYDFAALFVGDGVTETFTLGIPQTSTFLYNVVIKLFLNGVETDTDALGISMTFTKLVNSVIVFFSGAFPANAYGVLYLARGLYEGLEPTFGYQDPAGIVFQPTPASYQHFFARLISATFDPSTVMQGCPTPEERIETNLADLFTIVVRTAPQVLTIPPPPVLLGQEVVASVASFVGTGLDIVKHILLIGVSVTTTSENFVKIIVLTGVGAIAQTSRMISNDRLSLLGVSAITAISSLRPAPPLVTGIAVISMAGDFVLNLSTSPTMAGVSAHSAVNDALGSIFVGAEVTTSAGILTIGTQMSGAPTATASAGSLARSLIETLTGAAVVTGAGIFFSSSSSMTMPGATTSTDAGQITTGIG